MTTEERIEIYLREHGPTASSGLKVALGTRQGYVTKTIGKMLVAGQVERINMSNGVRHYVLAEDTRKRREDIIEYLNGHADCTAKQVAEATGYAITPVSKVLAELVDDGMASRRKDNHNRVWVYCSATPMPYGCANPLTMMFNKALREVRFELS